MVFSICMPLFIGACCFLFLGLITIWHNQQHREEMAALRRADRARRNQGSGSTIHTGYSTFAASRASLPRRNQQIGTRVFNTSDDRFTQSPIQEAQTPEQAGSSSAAARTMSQEQQLDRYAGTLQGSPERNVPSDGNLLSHATSARRGPWRGTSDGDDGPQQAPSGSRGFEIGPSNSGSSESAPTDAAAIEADDTAPSQSVPVPNGDRHDEEQQTAETNSNASTSSKRSSSSSSE